MGRHPTRSAAPTGPERWLILADDLTGAADCAIAFAQYGRAASISWDDGVIPEDSVLAIDADSRRLAPSDAAARHRALLGARHTQGVGLFKKIDSTLRGQPAAELAETTRVMRDGGHGALAIMAPAFPATGRTTEAGRIRLRGQPLETTALWAKDHSYASADIVAVLEAEGLRTRLAGLDVTRAGPDRLARLMREAIGAGIDVVVCDATVEADLDTVARATLPLAESVFWVGTGGLARALAQASKSNESTRAATPIVAGGILFVVGSVAEASRAASALLAADGAVRVVIVTPETLLAGPDGAEWWLAASRIKAALAAGGDVLVEIAADAVSATDLSRGADLARRLAQVLQPAAPHIGAIFATGGETALALLSALGVTGIRLIEEIEDGVPLGVTRGALTVPVVTKAGAFGDAGTLRRCLTQLRRSRPTENQP